jgi:hypothetical protein
MFSAREMGKETTKKRDVATILKLQKRTRMNENMDLWVI